MRRDYAGMAALVLAVTVGGGWSAVVILEATPWTPPSTPEAGQLLGGIGHVLAGALAAYLGFSLRDLHQRPRVHHRGETGNPDDDDDA